MTATRKTVSLVLGSGGARGLAHIGIIGWLEEHGYSIESISGCSMGALIGGIYACGKLDVFDLEAKKRLKGSWHSNGHLYLQLPGWEEQLFAVITKYDKLENKTKKGGDGVHDVVTWSATRD